MEWATNERAVHLPRLIHLFNQYCTNTAQPATQKMMLDLLRSPTVAALLDLREQDWSSVLVNDLYKAGMHKMYATYLSNVSADFALQVRRSPVTLACMARQRPRLFKALQDRVSALQSVQPYSPEVQHAMSRYADGFTCSQEMLERASKQGVAPVSWQAGHLPSGNYADVCIASGPIEAASHAETTVLQLVQAAIIRYQVEELREQQGLTRYGTQECSSTGAAGSSGGHMEEHNSKLPLTEGPSATTPDARDPSQHPSATSCSNGAGPSRGESGRGPDEECERGWWLDRTELLANSLAHLARVVDGLNSKDHGFELALFAGRRSSDRLFLVLQTLVFARLVKGYIGTSSLFVASLLDKAWDQVGLPLSERKMQLGRLLGTHAHEQSMLVQQLLAEFDNQAGEVSRRRGSGPVNVTALVAHLMHLAANGGLAGATALSDTFGSAGFVATASAADVPPAFIKIMEDAHGERVPDGAKCFDLFRVWRVDSGDYVAIASHILEAWKERCAQLAAAGLPTLPAPQFIHSNLRDVEQILKLADLPPHLKPKTLAFGSLADGFLPFPKPPHALPVAGDQEDLQQSHRQQPQQNTHPSAAASVGIGLGSIVMKAVQGFVCGERSAQASALKLGDDPSEAKLIVDPRIEPAERPVLVEAARLMARVDKADIDGAALSQVLSNAFEAGTTRFKENFGDVSKKPHQGDCMATARRQAGSF
ncbi:hypothetical protein DUNSADRAFT_8376 [Dunaliella salina]|uniref:Uncharacterized protein n=1 Tax=Dunaliella salina TaxID=3046 RepID=A0ABQ7GJR3_DUNSA|nr:hypothetical protein DUNSADRAFT_8376 [Dunaliella salina]|eukprot:KAF5834836.1 hypothetical protein DUNSADRAFT_8376 [Dunaliella salina]